MVDDDAARHGAPRRRRGAEPHRRRARRAARRVPLRFLVWGAGAIGGTIGAHLARSGHDVTFVDRVGEHVEAIRSGGLRITGPLAEFTARIPAFAPDDLAGTFEHIVLAVKAQDTEAATRALVPHLGAD